MTHSAVTPLKISHNSLVSGRFILSVGRSDGSGKRLLAEFDNLILDQGLDQMFTFTGNRFCGYFHVGASSAAEDASQTGLMSRIAVGGGSQGFNQGASYALEGGDVVVTAVTRHRFAPGAATGNIAEVGIGWGTSVNQLFSRALVKDALGNPTVVTVLPDEYLDVTYVLKIRHVLEDAPFTLNLSSGSHDGLLRLARMEALPGIYDFLDRGLGLDRLTYVRASNQPMGPITGSLPGGSTVSLGSVERELGAYTPGSFSRTVGFTFLPGVANLSGGIRSLMFEFTNWLNYQMQFTPAVPKTSTQLFTVQLQVSVGRG